jgi:hypothetical protein
LEDRPAFVFDKLDCNVRDRFGFAGKPGCGSRAKAVVGAPVGGCGLSFLGWSEGCGFCCGAASSIFTSSLASEGECAVAFALPLSRGRGTGDARGVLVRASISGGGRGEVGRGDGSRCARRTSTALLGSKGDLDSGAADGPEGSEAFDLTSAAKRALGERRCGELRRGGVGDRGRRSLEAGGKDKACKMNDHKQFREKEETYVNDGAVTTIAHLADGSWNVDVVGHYAGHIGGRGHSGHVGRGCDHNPASQSRGHDYIHVCRGHCRSRVNDHQSLSDGHSPFCQARNSASHIVCRHDDSRLLLAHPSRTEGDRVSFCGEDGVHWDDKSYCTVGATVAVEIFEENVGAFLEVDDLEEPQSRA